MHEKVSVTKDRMQRDMHSYANLKIEGFGTVEISYPIDYLVDMEQKQLEGHRVGIKCMQDVKKMSFVNFRVIDFEIYVEPNPYGFSYKAEKMPELVKQLEKVEELRPILQSIIDYYFPEDKRKMSETS